MKVNIEKIVNASIKQVWAAMDNPDNLSRWQPTLESFTHKHGQPGQPDSVAELVYNENGRKIMMTETVTERREPDFLAGTYETNWGKTLIVNTFKAMDDGRTQWNMYSNMSFKGMMRFFSIFFAGSIRKRTEADMSRFAEMVESDATSSS
ncbi:MAG: SRPBCC family protein [Gammaproteobacteria bacterium]|nr:SRPBCC family protein [Gammaproteobacteria bacterium]